jgi:peptidoglycan hydrolase CwlO-like protein
MKKISLLAMSVLFVGIVSCRDTKKEQEELDSTLDAIEAVEQEIDDTVEKVEKKTEEVESVLKQLDSI